MNEPPPPSPPSRLEAEAPAVSPAPAESPPGGEVERLVDRHLRAGWWGIAVFVAVGAGLELLHAVKAPFYLDAGSETTRLMLRLGHAHGALLSLLQLAFALTVRARPGAASPSASALLLGALVLVPGGFLLGGAWARAGDPGIGVLLVPAGALALLVVAALTARRLAP